MEYYKIGFHFFHLLKCNYFAVLSSLSEPVACLLSLAVMPTVNSDVQWGHLVALYFISVKQYGQTFVSGSTGATGASSFLCFFNLPFCQ